MDPRLRGDDELKGNGQSHWIPAFAGMTATRTVESLHYCVVGMTAQREAAKSLDPRFRGEDGNENGRVTASLRGGDDDTREKYATEFPLSRE
jgi:uncharacterized protein YgiB involved in biofilm formation